MYIARDFRGLRGVLFPVAHRYSHYVEDVDDAERRGDVTVRISVWVRSHDALRGADHDHVKNIHVQIMGNIRLAPVPVHQRTVVHTVPWEQCVSHAVAVEVCGVVAAPEVAFTPLS